jgi:ABC-2 type transport system permease protein
MKGNLRAMLAIIRKDVAVFFRRPISILVTLAPPIIFLLVIVNSASAVGRNPVALVVLDDGPRAHALASVIEGSGAFRVLRTDQVEAARMLSSLDVAAVVTIPAGFDWRFDAHQTDPVSIQINNLNLDFTNDLRRSLPAAIATFYAQQQGSTVAVTMRETDLRSRDVNLIQFELVPNLVLLLVVAGAVNGSLGVASEFDGQTIKELVLSPASRWAIVAGKLLGGWVAAMVVAGVVIGIAGVTGLLRPSGWYWLTTLGITALIGLASAGLGAAIGARLRTMAKVAPVAINLSIWLFFLSGGIGVAAFLPKWVQTIAAFTPTFYGVHALQMSIFYSSTDQLGRDVLVLGVTVVIALAAGTVALRRSTVD